MRNSATSFVKPCRERLPKGLEVNATQRCFRQATAPALQGSLRGSFHFPRRCSAQFAYSLLEDRRAARRLAGQRVDSVHFCRRTAQGFQREACYRREAQRRSGRLRTARHLAIRRRKEPRNGLGGFGITHPIQAQRQRADHQFGIEPGRHNPSAARRGGRAD